jgi:hypothetical protein
MFQSILNITAPNTMIVYRHNTRNETDQLLFRMQLVERLFVQYKNVAECDNTVLLNSVSPRRYHQLGINLGHKNVSCVQNMEERGTQATGVKSVMLHCFHCSEDYHTKLY